VEGWGKLVPEVFDRGYWFNLADPGLPFFMIKRVADEVPLGQKLGIRGWRVESLDNYSGGAPSLYLASRLQWNVDTDVNALMADFYDKFFGPAAKPMQAYIETMDDAVYNGDYHSGSSWEAPEIFNEAIRSKARAALKSAGALVKPDSLYGRRVEMYDKNFRYLEAFVAMLEKRANHDYAGAMKALGEIDVLRDDLSNHPFPLISRKAKEYMERFFRAATVQGYERTTGGNELVAPLVNDWEFKIDPEKVGSVDDLTGKIDAKYLINRDKTARFFNKATDAGGGWQKVAPYTTTWSDLGLRHFKGKAWYRQTVDVPAKFKDKRIFLWFGGVDEKVVVWVNNVQIGSGSGSFRPFELDATNAVTPGKNTVVVQAINEQLNELGTGGIVAPVMFYAPVKGAEAVPQGSIGKGDESLEIIAE
jgi:hypothetical protein